MDSDRAGDWLGRKSTTGVIVRKGKRLLRHMSCLQTLVALSSGEAEYYALIRGACTKPLPGRTIREWSEHVGQKWLQQPQQQQMMENIVKDA